MDDMAELALEGATYGIDNFDKVYDPLKAKVQSMRHANGGTSKSRDPDQPRYRDEYDYKPPTDDGFDRRGSRQDYGRRSNGRDVNNGRPYIRETYYRESGRAKSAGRDGYHGEGWGTDSRGRGLGRRELYDSDLSSSASPPPRRRRESARAIEGGQYDIRDGPPRAQTFADSSSTRSRMPAGYLGMAGRDDGSSDQVVSTRRDPAWTEPRGRERSASTDSSSSSTTLPSSSEDEREFKKMKGKEYISAGLAAVATIHALHGVKSSLEARDKRHQELEKGEITYQEARRKRNKLRLQDAAAIGIAALGIKGAYSEWQEVKESREEVKKKDQERKERHKRRLKRAERQARGAGMQGYGGRADDRNDGRRDRGDRRDGYRSA